MPRDLILGTAGHIDHGKTSLVKALTGIDCDRLPEEKARGITIDIGFAQLDLGETRLGIVDVPGHERFIKNMLAGATGIDLALLVVAADDSVMPQTREHFEILKLLGVRQGVIAVTKADTVDETTREVVGLEVRELVKGSFLENVPLVFTSAKTGQGIAELKTALAAACVNVESFDGDEQFRLPIDRAFVVQGHGTVVTGSVLGGIVHVGDELDWHKGDGTIERIRVRGLNNHGDAVQEAHRGQRAAVNLAGVPHEQVFRGQELAAPGLLVPSRVLTVRLYSSAEFHRPIRHRLPCRLHIGTAEVMASVSLLDCDQIQPAQWGLGQFFLETPVTAVWGQPFVVRDSSAEHTLGGGQILQPSTTKVRRRHIQVLEWIERLWSDDGDVRAFAAAWFAAYDGFAATDLVRQCGIAPGRITAVVTRLASSGRLLELSISPTRTLLLHADRIAELEERLQATLATLHEALPLLTTHDRIKVLAALDYVGDRDLLRVVTDRLLKAKKLVGDDRRIARADFKPRLSVNQRKLKDRIVDAHLSAGFQPPDAKDFVNTAGGNAIALNDIYEVAVAEGLLVRIADEFFLHSDVEAEMLARVRQRLVNGSGATVAEIRDLLGTTRKFAVPICEYIDRIGITRRDGDLRVLRQVES